MDGVDIPRERLIDTALLLGLAVAFLASGRPADPVGVMLAGVVVGALWFRRRRPLAVVLVIAAAYSAWALLGYTPHPLGALPAGVALFTLGAADEALTAKIVGVVVLVVAFSTIAVGLMDLRPSEGLFFVSVFVGIWWAGTVVASRNRYAAELEERTGQLEAARLELADQAVAEERARLARELHDVVSHSLGTITLQAGVGSHLAERDPARSAEALQVIERTGRATLEELRRLLGLMRDPAAEGARVPQPGLDDIEGLVLQMADAGMDVRLTINGEPGPLPMMVELSAYRVVQESLTNVMKHAAGSVVQVVVDHRPETLDVVVTSTGAGVSDGGGGGRGLGLRGMRERVTLLDGAFSAGATADGWRVWARFPRGES